jgi:hypothetical protein
VAWSLWALTTNCHQLGLDHHKLDFKEHEWPSWDIVANIFSNIGLNEVQKASFSLEHDVQPNSYKKIITDKERQIQGFSVWGFQVWVSGCRQMTIWLKLWSMVFLQFTYKWFCTFWSGESYI